MILYIIRHGETLWNRKRKLQGQIDIPLAEEGIRLAKITGENMMDIPFDLAYTSPLGRAKETAKLVLNDRKIPVIEDARIQEISFGEWEGECILDSQVLPKNFNEVFFRDIKNYVVPPQGESFAEVCARTKTFYEDLAGQEALADKHILISTHGCAGRCLLNNFYEDKEDIWRGGVPANCAVTIVEVKNGISHILEKDKLYYEA